MAVCDEGLEITDVEGIEFDKYGRMKFHPEFHTEHGKDLSIIDLEYLCKYVETDGVKSMAMALGKTEMVIFSKMQNLKKRGLFEYYKNLNLYW